MKEHKKDNVDKIIYYNIDSINKKELKIRWYN